MTGLPKRRHYERAPIMEAAIDIQVESLTKATDVSVLASKLKDQFPTSLPMYQLEMGVQVGPAPGAGPQFMNQHRTLGVRLDSSKRDRVLQLRTQGFTYSHLPPYSDWSTFSAEAEVLWQRYVDEFGPSRVNRIAVRVINNLPLATTEIGNRLDKYLNLYPTIPTSLPSETRGFLMQLRLPMTQIDQDALAVITLQNASANPGTIGIVLDIDLFVERHTEVGPGIFQLLNVLGYRKDEIFEACITDAIRERIK
jgi:uncharacterized protein (TIGR04255 family)